MREHNKPLLGFEGIYEISPIGEIYSLRRKIFLKPSVDKDGYLKIVLNYKGTSHYKRVHRLVAETFLPNHLNKPFVNHINEIKTDNHVDNLEWVTAKENSNHGTRNQRMALSKSIKPVERSVGGKWQKFKGVKEAARITGINRCQIAKCCKGLVKTAGGYKWRYFNEKDNVA